MKFASKSDYVLGIVKKRILDGIYKQGDSIVISKVANELEVSSIPVREAIKRLESEGLVQILPHKGARVSVLNKEQITDIIHVRIVLEAYAAAISIDYINEEDIKKLRDLIREMDEYAAELNDELFTQSNTEFHRYIYERCPYAKFNTLINNLWEGGNYTKSVFAYYPERMAQSNSEHREIIDAIESKDASRVESLIRKHKMKNISLLLKVSCKK